MREEAWALAEYLDNNVEAMLASEQKHIDDAAKTIRSLVGELNKYKMAWNMAENELEKRKKPLSDEEIKEVWFSLERELNTTIKYGLKLARAIEERHGIK